MNKFELTSNDYCTLDSNNFSFYCGSSPKENIVVPFSSINSLIQESGDSSVTMNYLNNKDKKCKKKLYFKSENIASDFLDQFKKDNDVLSDSSRQLSRSESLLEPLSVFGYLLLVIGGIGLLIWIILACFASGAESVRVPILIIPIFKLYEFLGFSKMIIIGSIPFIIWLIWTIVRVSKPPYIREIKKFA